MLEGLVDLNAEIYGYDGPRDLLTVITDSEKDPAVMGFSLLGDEPALFPEVDRQQAEDIQVAPEDVVIGKEIEGDVELQEGVQVPLEGKLVFSPSPTEMVLVNGVELTPESSLQALRTALTFHALSTSGSKSKCFTRLLNHQKQQELEIIHAATEHYKSELARVPKAVDLKVPPSEEEQQLHNLSHLPYAPWCASCVCFRARADKQQRSDGARRAGVATISFDFCYTKSVPESMDEKQVDTMVGLVMCDSATGYLHAVPLRSKNQWSLMTRELLGFAGSLGHSELVFMCDNEPTLLQLQRMVVNARLSMGLPTRKTNPAPYSHGNSLVENAVGRIRPLAGTLVHFLSDQVGVEFSTNSPWWSWAFRHACFLLNRFSPTRGATAYELLYNKAYGGAICNFGEPVYGFANVTGKGTAKWRRMVFLGKSDPQDTYLLFDGHGLVLTRSIRRISTVWRGHLPFYLNFNCWSWEYKTGFGGRVVPTKAQKGALSASFNGPVGAIEPSAFFDEDAEAVRLKHLEEVREEAEIVEMTLHDKQPPQDVQPELEDDKGEQPRYPNPIGIFDGEGQPVVVAGQPMAQDVSFAATSSAAASAEVPQTPDVFAPVPTTPRQNPTTRQHDAETDDHDAKRARVESAKKQRLERISAEYKSMIRTVKFGEETFYTMDEYNNELQLDDHDNVDAWMEDEKEDYVATDIPPELWSDFPTDRCPPTPDESIDRIADRVELSRLCGMKVLVEGNVDDIDAKHNTLTSRFVYDWRLKERLMPDGTTGKCWLRRSRLVAREYSFWEKRSDTYAPATSTHILNLLPMMYLQSLANVADDNHHANEPLCLGTLDVKDAFLMVDQPSPMLVTLLEQTFTVRKNLPGQRLGARSWYWYLRDFLSTEMDFKWCSEQPCLARNARCRIMVHVDDILFCGNRDYWMKTFLVKFAAKFKISHSELGEMGSEVSFLKRRIKRVETGLALLPGTSADKVIKLFEDHFGKVRNQSIPCDGGIHTEDLSAELSCDQAFAFRSVVGTCLYLARDRPDLLFTVKELSGSMSKPTLTALQRLRKLVGYLKTTPEYCVLLDVPIGGQGRWKSSDKHWILESFSDSDWSANQTHRRSTSCGVHLLNGAFLFGSSRTQRVVSLSSCESELHAMISTLSDGIFLKRCLEFVFNAEVEHVLFTDSSSGRQLAMRQGTGKVKHLSGKVLWIQDAVRNGVIQLSQIPTIWNVSDIGTKALGVQRTQLLLHELNIASSPDFFVVGMPEYERQCQRHGGNKQLTKLVKQVTRVLVMMGLESSTASGVAAISMLDCDDSSSYGTCMVEPNIQVSGGVNVSYVLLAFFFGMFLGILVVLYKTYKRARDAFESYEHMYTQMAILDSAYNRLQDQYEGLREQHFTDIGILDNLVDRHVQEIGVLQGQITGLNEAMRRLREGHNELQGELKMLSDSTEQIHFGLVQVGGYTPFRALEANDRRHMYEVERGNLVARRVMGTDRYLATVRHQNQGVAQGEDTDMDRTSEGGESEAVENDEVMEPRGNLSQAMDIFRNELNECLARHDYQMAAQFQQCILMMLDAMNGTIPMTNEVRVNLFNELANNLEGMADQVRPQLPHLAERYLTYCGQCRNMNFGSG